MTSNSRLGLPLLSGSPPVPNFDEPGCRKCNKEFNVIFTRARRCGHCGYSYCHSCTDYQALMPRSGVESGYDPANVCAFCVEFLQITAGGRSFLKSLSLAKLNKYVNAYNIRMDRAVEKDDLVDAIVKARESNGCLPPANEHFYRKYSVPTKVPGTRPRGLFTRSTAARNPPSTLPPRPNSTNLQTFARPDLAPDPPPPQQQYAPPPGPPPRPRPASAAQAPPSTPPRPANNNRPPTAPPPGPQFRFSPGYTPQYTSSPPPPQPPQPNRPFPGFHYGQHSPASRSSHNVNSPPPTNNSSRPEPPRQRAASAAPPPVAPTPSLEELLNMTRAAIGTLSIGTLKAILFNNRVNAGLIIEKADLVKKVSDLVDDERKERERAKMLEEQEERERLERQRAVKEEMQKKKEGEEGEKAGPGTSRSPGAMASALERNGLCVICQDDEANIAIVDCGHMAMCKTCSDMVMSSTKECPLCRTRIVTEQRLLRIFKT